MEQWILWTFLLALTAFILSIIALYKQGDEPDNSGKIALRSVEALADKLGFELRQYPFLGQTGAYHKPGEYKTPAAWIDLCEHRQDFSRLLDHLGLEFVEEGRKLSKKKNTK